MIERDRGEESTTIEDATSGNFADSWHESCSIPPNFRMFFIESNTMTVLQDLLESRKHNVSKQLIGMMEGPEDFIKGFWSSLVLVFPEKKLVIAFGGYFKDGECANGRSWPIGPHDHVVRLCFEDMSVEELTPMLHPRFGPGVIQVSNYIYLFGGGEGTQDNPSTLRESELYDIHNNSWTVLPSMPAGKRCFNPALYRLYIYLVGGIGTSCSYAFNRDSGMYTELAFYLPDTGEQGLTLIHDSNLVFLSKGKKYVFCLEPFQLMASIEDAGITVFPRSCVAPIQHEDYSYVTALFKDTEGKRARYFASYNWRNEEYKLIAYFRNDHDECP